MTEISIEQLNHLEELSALKFSKCEKEKMKNNLSQILDFISQIDNCNSSIEELPEKCVTLDSLRDDAPEIGLTKQETLNNAPRKSDSYFCVTKVVD